MIRLSKIWKTYEMGTQKLHALQDVSTTIEQGEHLAIMGPSGSGKSTLLNIVGCLDQPTSGEYFLDGEDVAQLSDDDLAEVRLRKIGFVFQSFHLIPRLSALANVALPMVFAGVPAAEREERAREAIDSVGLADWSDHKPAELSGGQKQRVAVARAVVMRPGLLLADEPTGNLDSASGRQVLDILCGLNQQGITLITVTHDPNVARLAERVMVLTDGAILREVEGRKVSTLDDLFSPVASGARDELA
ncbi:MAG: ABC transporter ATP-binding protein [Myxococcota bacterium]|nr:ABC transporter ATP-binding protein [Myxococcota bacterium]